MDKNATRGKQNSTNGDHAKDIIWTPDPKRPFEMDPRIPRGGGHTEEEYFALPDDLRVELIDGHFFTMDSPSKPHQKVAFEIAKQLDDCIEEHEGETDQECFLYIAPSDVALGEDKKTIVQPDVYVHCDKAKEKKKGPHRGTPDFVLEVLSPSNPEHDLWRKRELYERHGVREYWIVNPVRCSVLVFRFDKDEDDETSAMAYTFEDEVPVGISDGKCSVDFRKVYRKLEHLL